KTLDVLGVPHLGDDSDLHRYPDAALVLGVGAVRSPHPRREVVDRVGGGRHWASVVHPRSYVSRSARIADGVVVLPHAILHAGVRAGAHSLVNSGATV